MVLLCCTVKFENLQYFFETIIQFQIYLVAIVVHKILSIEGNVFTFELICYFCPGSPKNQHLDSPI